MIDCGTRRHPTIGYDAPLPLETMTDAKFKVSPVRGQDKCCHGIRMADIVIRDNNANDIFWQSTELSAAGHALPESLLNELPFENFL
ncbi:hypothetical protein [Paraburkholderia sp. JHI869]|uniref:hypothetical protein n=1 Tax=Paraburkholderia sp. JHI869 TaxID=3112959 RepID=UPI00316BE294